MGDGVGEAGVAVVVGGGIAGVCCAEELCRLRPAMRVYLISASEVLKGVETMAHVTQNIEELKVVERPLSSLNSTWSNMEVLCDTVVQYDLPAKALRLSEGRQLRYDKLCIATGAKPRVVFDHPSVLSIRDTRSVQELCERVIGSKRVLVVGNGGIALETVYALKDLVEVVWVVKHEQIGDAFFDRDAARFLLEQLQPCGAMQPAAAMGHPPTAEAASPTSSAIRASGGAARQEAGQAQQLGKPTILQGRGVPGHAAGPRWMDALPPRSSPALASGCTGVILEHSEILGIQHGSGRAEAADVTLANGMVYDADIVISAVGVEPNTEGLPAELERATDGGLRVSRRMETSCAGVYAAGDVCTMDRATDEPSQWFQMRLWTQARVMGAFAGHCMANAVDELYSGFNFELFTHCTHFFGMKVVLLGLYNGQTLDSEPEEEVVTYQRHMVQGGSHTFVRVLLLRGCMQGALLIGETDLEEVCENLILTQLDLSDVGPQLLDPDVELDHIFD